LIQLGRFGYNVAPNLKINLKNTLPNPNKPVTSSSPFPLPLGPMEHYFLVSDSEKYPMSAWVCCWFTGVFDRIFFLESLQATIQRHPLLGSVVQGDKLHRTSNLHWVKQNNPLPHVDWAKEETPFDFPQGEWIDLQKETGLRVFIREQEDRTRLFLQFHHACCDGIASTEFLNDLLTIYAAKKSGAPPLGNLRRLDERYLETRNKFKLSWKRRLLEYPLGLYRAARFFFKRVRPIGMSHAPWSFSRLDLAEPAYFLERFTREETHRIKNTAKQNGCSLNDLFLRDLFLAIDKWNAQCCPNENKQPIRIATPINLRKLVTSSKEMPANNCFSLILVDRKPRQLSSPEKLLKSIRRETRCLKNWEPGTWFYKMLKIAGILGGKSFLLPSGERCHGSTMFSFMDELMRECPLMGDQGLLCAANMKLEMLTGLVPITNSTPVVFFCSSYDKCFSINIHYDPKKISDTQAKALLEMYCDQIKRSSSI
jgi:NRPS condensation-like uncharacterized protein